MSEKNKNTTLNDNAKINDMLSTAYLVRHGLSSEPAPDLSQYSLEDLRKAAAAIRAQPGEPQSDGSTKFSCVVAEEEIAGLRHWSITGRTGHSKPKLVVNLD